MIDTDLKFENAVIGGVYGLSGIPLNKIITLSKSQEKQIEVFTIFSGIDSKQYFVLPGATKENLKVKRIEEKTYSFSYINPANKLEIYTELTFDDMLDSVEVKDGIAYFTFKKEDNIVKVK